LLQAEEKLGELKEELTVCKNGGAKGSEEDMSTTAMVAAETGAREGTEGGQGPED
jgi:hypothetical protein